MPQPYTPKYATKQAIPAVPDHNLTYLSGIIRFAHYALEKFEATPGCKADMRTWHIKRSPKQGGPAVCYACLGGAALVELAGGIPVDSSFWRVGDFSPSIADIAEQRADLATRIGVGLWCVTTLENALDYIRIGCVREALGLLGISVAGIPDDDERPLITPYDVNPQKFKEDLLRLADWLEDFGY